MCDRPSLAAEPLGPSHDCQKFSWHFTVAAATASNNGTWYDLTTGWGFNNPDLTETELLAANTVSIEVLLNLAKSGKLTFSLIQLFYFATQPFTGPVQAEE